MPGLSLMSDLFFLSQELPICFPEEKANRKPSKRDPEAAGAAAAEWHKGPGHSRTHGQTAEQAATTSGEKCGSQERGEQLTLR